MILAINKPKGPTSHDIIDMIRAKTGVSRVGHAGTLDPLASGVLVVAIGRDDTKKLNNIVMSEKEYVATIELGKTSTTDDDEGEKAEISFEKRPSLNEVKEAAGSFVGEILQVPPIYSSIKIKGKPAHRRVRKGEEIKLEARKVRVVKIHIQKYEWPIFIIKLTTGPGFYVRSFARDLGEVLRTGGYLKDLERVRVGDYTLETAITVDAIEGPF